MTTAGRAAPPLSSQAIWRAFWWWAGRTIITGAYSTRRFSRSDFFWRRQRFATCGAMLWRGQTRRDRSAAAPLPLQPLAFLAAGRRQVRTAVMTMRLGQIVAEFFAKMG